ncbi:hypothetical protein HZ326_2562 [Fusarium oxysporum f. sp. albedinis]|nr:hypothetical protein HZ326_2562 [Fusarium oxysporum f. sp. albedinis]
MFHTLFEGEDLARLGGATHTRIRLSTRTYNTILTLLIAKSHTSHPLTEFLASIHRPFLCFNFSYSSSNWASTSPIFIPPSHFQYLVSIPILEFRLPRRRPRL